MKLPAKTFALFLIFSLLILSSESLALADDISPVVPSIASFILPGSGQLINDQPDKALTHFVVFVGIDAAAYVLLPHTSMYYGLGTLHFAWSSYSAYDAYQVARRKRGSIFNSSLQLEDASNFSKDLSLAGSFSLDQRSGLSVSRVPAGERST